jgi:hypothetical protein
VTTAPPSEAANALWHWLSQSTEPHRSFEQAFKGVALGLTRPRVGTPILERIAVELVTSILPVALGVDTRADEERRRLLRASEFVSWIAEWAANNLHSDLAAVQSFRRALPSTKQLFDQPYHYFPDQSGVQSLYREYVQLGAVSPNTERLLLAASVGSCVSIEAQPMLPELTGKRMSSSPNRAYEFFGMIVGMAFVATVVAVVWSWLEFGGDNADSAYVFGWGLGRFIPVYLTLLLLGTIGTFRHWAEETHWIQGREDKAVSFKKSALVSLYEEAPSATQARLASLAKMARDQGTSCPDPIDAVLQRSTSRSPDDWLNAI